MSLGSRYYQELPVELAGAKYEALKVPDIHIWQVSKVIEEVSSEVSFCSNGEGPTITKKVKHHLLFLFVHAAAAKIIRE